MSLDLENFEEVRIKGEEIYSNLKEIYCPYFKDKIYFNSQGIEHLKFKRQRQARPPARSIYEIKTHTHSSSYFRKNFYITRSVGN